MFPLSLAGHCLVLHVPQSIYSECITRNTGHPLESSFKKTFLKPGRAVRGRKWPLRNNSVKTFLEKSRSPFAPSPLTRKPPSKLVRVGVPYLVLYCLVWPFNTALGGALNVGQPLCTRRISLSLYTEFTDNGFRKSPLIVARSTGRPTSMTLRRVCAKSLDNNCGAMALEWCARLR